MTEAQLSSLAVLPAWLPRMNYRRAFVMLVTYFVLLLVVTIVLFPVFWMASSSLRPPPEMFAHGVRLLPVTWTLANYAHVWLDTDFPAYFWNSFKVASIATCLSVLVSMYAAYALARIYFPGRYAYGLLLLATQMFPQILLVIPLFVILRGLGLFNTHAALIIAYTAFSLPFNIWLLRGFFEAIPEELEDAAAIDGASILGTFHRVILPLAGPGLAAVTMFSFIRAWNEFLFALVFLQSHELFTLPIGLASFQEEFTFRWDLIMAGAGIITLPVLFFFLVMQRFIVQGLLGGAVKG